MATFSNGESGFSVRTKINDVLQHMDGTTGTLVVNEAGADVDFRVESDTIVNALFVDGATGNVGLGTGTPAGSLDIVTGAARFRVSNDGGGNINIETLNSAGVSYSDYKQYGNTLIYYTSGTERMRIDSAGNTTIGAPAVFSGQRLDVNGNIRTSNGSGGTISAFETDTVRSNRIVLGADASGSYLNASFGSVGTAVMRFQTANLERMRIDATGIVGIGTVIPASYATRLAVIGGNLGISEEGSTVFTLRSNAGVSSLGAFSATGAALTFRTAPSGGGEVERMRIDSVGNVGIGTTTPAYPLSVNSSATAGTSSQIQIRSGNAADSALLFGDTDAAAIGRVTYAHATNSMSFTVNNSTAVTIDNNGNVGIGSTPSGAGRLDVNGSIRTSPGSGGTITAFETDVVRANQMVLGSDASGSFMNATFGSGGSAILRLQTAGTERMRIDAAGNVGIGTTTVTPIFGRTLQVGDGSILASIGLLGTGAGTTGDVFLTSGASTATLTARASTDLILGAGDVERMRIDAAGNVGLAVTPSVWSTGKAIEVFAAGNSLFSNGAGVVRLTSNAYFNGSYLYGNTAAASRYDQNIGVHSWHTAPSGTAGAAITFTQTMTLDANGNLGVGTTNPGARLNVNGGSIFVTTSGTYSEPAAVAGVIAFDSANGDLNISARSNGGNTFTRFFTSSAGTGAERMRIDNTGNVLVGTTAATGTASNAALTVSGGFRTASGSVVTTNGVAATAFSITAANRGRYDVVAMINNSGDAAQYASISTILWDGSTGRAISNNATNLTITLSGSNVQVTQTSGVGQTVNWSFTRVAS